MTGPTEVALEEPAAGEDRAPHPRAQREQHGVARAGGGALPCLAQESGVGVVEDADRGASRQRLLPDEALKAGQLAGRHRSDRSPIARGHAGSGHGDPRRRLGPARLQLAEERPGRLDEGARLAVARACLGAVEDVARLGDARRLDVRAADVDADRVGQG